MDTARPLERLYIAILAGGSGTRLWPLSRARRPKQLLQLTGERSLIKLDPPYGFVAATDSEYDNARRFFKDTLVNRN